MNKKHFQLLLEREIFTLLFIINQNPWAEATFYLYIIDYILGFKY